MLETGLQDDAHFFARARGRPSAHARNGQTAAKRPSDNKKESSSNRNGGAACLRLMRKRGGRTTAKYAEAHGSGRIGPARRI